MVRRNNDIKLSNLVLGKHIGRLRMEKDMSHMQLARSVKKTEKQIARYETGQDLIPLPILETFAEILDCPAPKKLIRKISSTRKLEIEQETNLDELLVDLYNQLFGGPQIV